MRKLFLLLLLITFGFTATAQHNLGTTYKEVKRAYKANSNFYLWQNLKADDGTPYVMYLDKSNQRMTACYFKRDIVTRFMLGGPEDKMGDFDSTLTAKFEKVSENTWIDKTSRCSWRRIKDGDKVYYIADPLSDAKH